MSRSKDDYTRCPNCHKKGVTLRLRANGEDHLKCRYCEWWAFMTPDDQGDRDKLAAHERENITITPTPKEPT